MKPDHVRRLQQLEQQWRREHNELQRAGHESYDLGIVANELAAVVSASLIDSQHDVANVLKAILDQQCKGSAFLDQAESLDISLNRVQVEFLLRAATKHYDIAQGMCMALALLGLTDHYTTEGRFA